MDTLVRPYTRCPRAHGHRVAWKVGKEVETGAMSQIGSNHARCRRRIKLTGTIIRQAQTQIPSWWRGVCHPHLRVDLVEGPSLQARAAFARINQRFGVNAAVILVQQQCRTTRLGSRKVDSRVSMHMWVLQPRRKWNISAFRSNCFRNLELFGYKVALGESTVRRP